MRDAQVVLTSLQMKTAIVIALCLAGSALAQQYTKDGELVLPKDYRQWIFLSSGIGLTYTGGSSENPAFENVFVNPEAYRDFLKTGLWPDKTVLVLEIRSSESRLSINKDGRVQTKVAAMEVHVKDSARGGWAFYGFHDGGNTGTLFPKTADCYSCHCCFPGECTNRNSPSNASKKSVCDRASDPDSDTLQSSRKILWECYERSKYTLRSVPRHYRRICERGAQHGEAGNPRDEDLCATVSSF